MYKNNKVISKHRSSAPPLLNGNSTCDVNMMKKYITVFNESDRFEDQDLENLTLGSARNVAEQDFELQQSLPSKERRARRNVPGKRKSRAGTLCEIKLSSVENLDQTTEQLSSRQPLLANNRYTPMKTLDERKTLQLNNLVNSQLGAQQMSVCQEAPFETTDMDVPVTAPLGLDLHSKDLTPNDPFPCKPVTWESEVSMAQTIGRDGEAWTSFPTTPGDRAITSKIDSENTASRYQDDLMNVTKEQSNSCVTKTPSPLLDISVNAANHWEMTEEMFSLNSAGKLSAGRKRFSRRASSVGARGSPETNSLICYIANQKMQESQRVSMLRRKMEAFMGTFQAAEQDENKTSTPELPHLSGLWQTGSTPAKEQDSTLSASCSKPAQKKKVTFGEELSPELFDERLPSNTPLRRGETPVYQKITFSDGLPSALKQRSKTHIALEEEKSTSGDVTCNGCSPENDHGDSTSIKLQAKFENDMEISATGTQNDDEDRCCPIPINFEIESPLSECKVGPDNQKGCNRNDEYPCEVLDVKIQELNEILPLTISPSGHPGERSNIRKDNVTICRNLTKKKTDCISKKLSKVKPELDKKIAAINKLKTSEMETESGVESDMDHMPCILNEMSKTGDGFLDQKNTDLSMNDGVQANFIGDTCPNIQNLSEQRDETEDKKVCSEALSADVSPNPTTKSQEEMKTRNEEQESKKEEPRRSARIKQNVLKNSTTATKGKRRQKFKKDLYGKREYASRKPLLSPIAEVLDIWSESEVLPDSDVMLECEPSRRTSLIYLEGIDIGRESKQCISKSECIPDGGDPAGTLTKSVGQKTRGRRGPRKRSIHRFEGEQNIQSDAESETQKWNTGDPRLVPKKSNKFKCSLKSGQSPSLCESKDMAFEVKALKDSRGDSVTKGSEPTVARRKSSIKIKSKPFSKEPSLERNSQKGIIGVQSLSEGQCAMETGHEEYSERIHADDYNGVGSFLESGSNVLEGFNERQQQSEPSETEELTPVSASTVSEKSRVMISEPVTSDIAILEEKDVYISPPDVREVFRSRPRHRRSKLFNAANLPYVMQSEQFLKVNGHRIFDAGDENEEKDENLSRGEERKESYSCNMIAEPTSPNQRMFFDGVGESQETNNCEPLFFSFGHPWEQVNSNIFEAADQLKTGIKYSDGFLQNAKSVKKKVRRSARLSGCMSKEGLSWVDVKSSEHLEKRNKSARLSRRSLGIIESESKLPSAKDVESKTATQARIRILRRRSLSCNRERAFELEEPLRKSIMLD